jgi:hypothetical protein
MALNYAESWSNELLEIRRQNSITSPFITQNVKWLNSKTFHFTLMSTSGFKNHSRAGGWNRGTYSQTDKTFTLTHDRDIEFLVDKADVDETNATASIQNISKVFEQTQASPETDALFFSKITAQAKTSELYTNTALSSYTKSNVFEKLKGMLKQGRLRAYKGNGSLIMYVNSTIMDLLEQSTAFTRKIEMTQISEGGIGLETRVTDIDGMTVMEVIDDDVFYDAFNFNGTNGGYELISNTSHKLNVCIASLETCKIVPKIASIYYFAPGSHTQGDGYLYQNRELSDVFVFPNGLNGKVDSIFVDIDTTAYTTE